MSFEYRVPVEEPTVAEDIERGEKTYSHPAYGKISVSQISGGTVLFGSDFEHRGFIEIRIRRAEHTRRLSGDWYHGREEIAAVRLSHAQWASFVSSMNMGDGVPCTLVHYDGKRIPNLPEPVQEKDRFKSEHAETLTDAIKHLDAAFALLKDGKLTAGIRNEVMERVRAARQEINANLPFVEQSFGEAVEEKIETAKTEIHGYLNMALTRIGLDLIEERRQVGVNTTLNIEGTSDAVDN